MKTQIELDYSTLDTWNTCERKALWQYDMGYYRVSDERLALEFGKAVHKFLETYDANGDASSAMLSAESLASSGPMKGVTKTDRYSLDHLRLLMNEYIAFYGKNDKRYTTVKTEMNLRSALYDSEDLRIVWVGNVDKIALDTTFNEHCVIENKTTYDVGERFEWKTWPNLQITGYAWLAQKSGYDVKRVIFNAIQSNEYYMTKTKGLSGKLVTKPTECFMRYEVPINETFFPEFEQSVIQVARDIVGVKDGNRIATCNAPNCCTMFNSKCQYQDVCRTFPADRQNVLDFNFQQKPWAHFKITKGVK